MQQPKPAEPKPTYRDDYQPPAYRVRQVQLTFELDPVATRVKAKLQLERAAQAEADKPLELEGEQLELKAIAIDGQPLRAEEYAVCATGLTVHNPPARFCLETEVQIAPRENTALEGLYLSNGIYCTQCEAEGFRRITYFPDRPDVMTTFSTTVIGDATRQPILLANGNPVERGELSDGRHFVTWDDPFPKPSYLFALVAGDLEKVEDSFTTASGRQVTLQIWVEQENLGKTEHAMASLKRAMRWDEETYGREYDLDLFMI
ncbi:MAG: aminopeptidase N, partial [Halomonadaceae bacterium]|nr:aminopeptidase N [Halomonadaceae bacterium]